MATDHIGPFLLTKLLVPKLLAAGTPSYTPRVVFVSSNAHTFGPGVDFSTIARPDPAKYKNMDAYGQAKTANILTAIELSKRSKGAINAYSLHPGGMSVFYGCKSTDTEKTLVIYTNAFLKPDMIVDMKTFGWLRSLRNPLKLTPVPPRCS